MRAACAAYPVNEHWVQCPDCEKYYDPNDRSGCEHGYGSATRVICPECAELNGYRECENCAEWSFEHELNDCDGSFYCTDCAERAGWVQCYRCDDWIRSRDSSAGADDNSYCCDCWCEEFTSCEGCGSTIYQDDAVCRRDSTYCSDCARSSGDTWDEAEFEGRDVYAKMPSQRKFGVEIETDDCDAYEDLEGDTIFGAKEDGSISGKEFVSPIMFGDDGFAAINELCKFGRRHGWSAGRSCGLHVHFNMGDEDAEGLKAIACAFHYTYDVWSAFVNCGRKSNSYCSKDEAELVDYLGMNALSNWRDYARRFNRYTWINWAAYYRHSSLEVRLHHGTVNADAICNWTAALAVFIDWASKTGQVAVRKALACRGNAERFEFIARLWQDAGRTDLVDYYAGKARENGESFVNETVFAASAE